MGDANGDVDVVIFYDHNCGYCRSLWPVIEKASTQEDGIRIVVREYPILSNESHAAALGALAVYQQGHYDQLQNELEKAEGGVDGAVIRSIAAKMGLDMAAFDAFIDSDVAKDEISKSYALARSLGIRWTPAVIIGDEVFPGLVDAKAIRDAVQRARN